MGHEVHVGGIAEHEGQFVGVTDVGRGRAGLRDRFQVPLGIRTIPNGKGTMVHIVITEDRIVTEGGAGGLGKFGVETGPHVVRHGLLELGLRPGRGHQGLIVGQDLRRGCLAEEEFHEAGIDDAGFQIVVREVRQEGDALAQVGAQHHRLGDLARDGVAGNELTVDHRIPGQQGLEASAFHFLQAIGEELAGDDLVDR